MGRVQSKRYANLRIEIRELLKQKQSTILAEYCNKIDKQNQAISSEKMNKDFFRREARQIAMIIFILSVVVSIVMYLFAKFAFSFFNTPQSGIVEIYISDLVGISLSVVIFVISVWLLNKWTEKIKNTQRPWAL